MPTFRERVEDYIGTVDDATGLDQFLKDAAQEVLSAANKAFLYRNATRYFSSSAAGFSIKGRHILGVSRRFSGYPVEAKEVPSGMAWQVTNPQSLHFATNRGPVYWIQVTATDTRLFIKPDPATGAEVEIYYLTYPSPVNTDSVAAGLPTEAEDAVVLATARRVLQNRLAAHQGEEDVEMVGAVSAEIGRINELLEQRMERLQRNQ